MSDWKKRFPRQAPTEPQVRAKALRLWGLYLLALLAWVAIVIAIAFFGFLICSSITWFSNNPLYWFLLWVRDYIVLVGAAVVLVGWAVISYFFLARPIRHLDALSQAATRLAAPTEEPITLPDGMEDTAAQLNLAREQALRSARAAREAEQRKNDLIVYLAHDLKTPLTSVIGYLTLLRDEPQISLELRARYTNIALDKAERLEELVNEFFDITRYNLQQLTLEKEPVDVSYLLVQLTDEFYPLLQAHGNTIELNVPQDLTVEGDAGKLARVFNNLLKNAVSYSTPGTPILLWAEQADEQAQFFVQNRGKTIPAHQLDALFEKFFRLDEARSTATGGAGLGLAIAKEIVTLHGGSISAHSEQGVTTFTVELPTKKSL